MELLGLDFESYFDKDYSLKKLGTLMYVRDPRFLIHGASVQHENGTPYWISRDEFPYFVKEQDWANTRMVAHNYYFDGLALFEHYGAEPAEKVCTLSLARALLGDHDLRLDLNSVCVALGIPGKIAGLEQTKGKRDLTLDELRALIPYANNDVARVMEVYHLLWPLLPENERRLLSLTLRMGTVPRLFIDTNHAQRESALAKEAHDQAIKAANVPKKILSSNPQFAEHLRRLGIEPPMKLNDKGERTFAFSKNDLPFKELMVNHPEHDKLFKARLAAKSTIRQSRAQRFLDIYATLERARQGVLPMPYKFSGAHTHRWSGLDGINVQNLPGIINKMIDSGLLRKSIIAPKGWVIVVADSSGVELRFNMWFNDEPQVLHILRSGQDVYSHTATAHFGFTVTKDMTERAFGKMLDLALGFGMGWRKFRINSALGFMGCDPVRLDEGEAQAAVQTYRNTHPGVVSGWEDLNNRLSQMTSKHYKDTRKCVEFGYERVTMPGGLDLSYPKLRCSEEGGWEYGLVNHHRIYGGLFDENIIQWLARNAVADQMLEIDELDEVYVVGMTHDEVIAITPERQADEVLKEMIRIMSTPPWWAPDIPLAAEGGFAHEYSK
jgi:hypothetical protein